MLMDRATKHTPETNKERGCQNRSGRGSVSPQLCHLRVTHSKYTATNSSSAKHSCSRIFCLQKTRFFFYCLSHCPSGSALSWIQAGFVCPQQIPLAKTRRLRPCNVWGEKALRLHPDLWEGAIHGAGEARAAAEPHRTLEQLQGLSTA